MSADLFTDLLLASLVIALSPIPIIAITLVLSTPRARANGLAGSAEWVGILVFVLLASWSVLGSTGFYLIATDKAASGLARLKDFMARNNALIMAALFAFFGVKLVIDGLSGLLRS